MLFGIYLLIVPHWLSSVFAGASDSAMMCKLIYVRSAGTRGSVNAARRVAKSCTVDDVLLLDRAAAVGAVMSLIHQVLRKKLAECS